jgi:hypothetical protein
MFQNQQQTPSYNLLQQTTNFNDSFSHLSNNQSQQQQSSQLGMNNTQNQNARYFLGYLAFFISVKNLIFVF